MFSWFRAVGLAVTLALVGGQAQAKWLRAETRHFVLYSDGAERELRDYAEKLEVFDEALRFFHATPSDDLNQKLDIYLVKDEEQLDRIWRKAYGVAGFYSADPNATFAVARRDGGDFAQTVLFHEYTHHFMLRNFAYPYPGWLVEGWAEYFGNSRVYRDRIDVGLPNNERGETMNAWRITTKDLFSKRYADLPEGGVFYFYARAWLVTHFMMADDARRAQLNAYMRLIGEGGDTIGSLEKVLGYDAATLDKNLKAYLRGRIPFTSIQRKAAPIAVTVTAMPASADDVLMERLRATSGVRIKDAEAAVKYIKFRAKGYPDDRLAQLTLARAHITMGDPADAEPILQRYVSDPDDAEALYLMGMRYMRMAEKELGHDQRRAEAEAKEDALKGKEDKDPPPPETEPDEQTRARAQAWYAKARPWLAKANHADPGSYEVLYAYAESRALDDDYPTEGTVKMLAAAYELAPQVDEITWTSAKALIARGRKDDAVNLLKLLANNPHGGTMSKRAKALLESLGAEAPAQPN